MPNPGNKASSGSITVTVSDQSIRLLDEIAGRGIYGKNKAEVAARFIDKALQEFVDPPRLKLDRDKQTK